jgi:small subunit ribosomal protein S18
MRFKKPKRRGRRKCPFTSKEGSPRPAFIDYKDVATLRKFISGQGKILSRKRTGTSAVYQRAVTEAIKRARFMGLLPYVAE